MGGHTSATSEDTDSGNYSEAVATTGLFLNIAAVIAIAVALASWTVGDVMLALVFGAIAAVGFVGSIACFVSQSADPEIVSPST